MILRIRIHACLLMGASLASPPAQEAAKVERWGNFEAEFRGPAEGNPCEDGTPFSPFRDRAAGQAVARASDTPRSLGGPGKQFLRPVAIDDLVRREVVGIRQE